jgi:aquaporin related protein
MSDNDTKKMAELNLPLHEPPTASAAKTRTQRHTLRTEVAAFIGEFIGTFMFLSLAFSGTQIALNAADTDELTSSDRPAPNVSKLLYIAFAFGISLAINVAIFADVSGGKFNPAVSLTRFLYVRHPHIR